MLPSVVYPSGRNLEHGVSDKKRNRSRDVSGGNERHDCNHGKASIVEFAALLNLHFLRIRRCEINRWKNDCRHISSFGVVCSLCLSHEFGEEDGEINLGFA